MYIVCRRAAEGCGSVQGRLEARHESVGLSVRRTCLSPMPRFDTRPSSAIPRPADGAFDPIVSTDAARRELGALAREHEAGEAHHRARPKSAATLVSSLSGASLPGWPLQEDEMRLSRKSDRAARWPPTPSSLQRPTSAASVGLLGSTADLKPDVSTAIAGRVDPLIRACKSGGPLHSGAGAYIQQAYENHGPLAPAPFTYGFLPESKMPPKPPPPPPVELLAEPQAPSSTGRGARRTKKDEEAERAAAEMQRMLASRLPAAEPKPKPLRVVYAHVRGKCIPVPVGGGKQVRVPPYEAAARLSMCFLFSFASLPARLCPILAYPWHVEPSARPRLHMHTYSTRMQACAFTLLPPLLDLFFLPARIYALHSTSIGWAPRRAPATSHRRNRTSHPSRTSSRRTASWRVSRSSRRLPRRRSRAASSEPAPHAARRRG